MKRKTTVQTMNKKTIAVTLLSLLLLIACIPTALTHNAPFPGGYDPTTLVIDVVGDPESMDPAWAYDKASAEVIQNVYETLIFFDVRYEDGPYNAGKMDVFVPQLASALPTIDYTPRTNPKSGLPIYSSWTFPIRHGVMFHSGWGEMKPHDIEYSFEREMVMDRYGGPAWMLFEPLLEVHYALDPYEEPDFGSWIDGAVESNDTAWTVTFNLVAAYPELTFKQILCQSWSSVVCKAWAISRGDFDGDWTADWEDIFDTWHNPEVSPLDVPTPDMVGTGPYKFSYWNSGVDYSVVRNVDYWQGWPAPCKSAIGGSGDTTTLGGYLETVVWREIASWNVRKGNFLSGTSDMTYVPRSARDQVLGQIVGGENIRCYYPIQPMLALDAFFFTFDVAGTSNYMGTHNPPAVTPPYTGSFTTTGMPPNLFSDINVRKGFALAFNYTNYLVQAWLNEGTQPADPVISGMAYDNPLNNKYSYLLHGAYSAEYYLQMAWGGVDSNNDGYCETPGALWNGGMKFQVVYNVGNVPRELASIEIRNEINSLNPTNFKLQTLGIDWGTQFLPAMVASELPLFLTGWSADFTDPHDMVFPFQHSLGTFPQCQRYGNPVVDALIEAGIATPNDSTPYTNQMDDPAPIVNLKMNNVGPGKPYSTDWKSWPTNPNAYISTPLDSRWPRRAIYYALQEIYYDELSSVPLVQPIGRHWEQAWMRGWYYNPLLGGGLAPGIDSTAPSTPTLLLYHLWKAKTHFGDVSGSTYGIADGAVGPDDAIFVINHWSSLASHFGYHPVADINGGTGATTGGNIGPVRGMPDGRVDKADYDLVRAYWDSPPGPSHPSMGGIGGMGGTMLSGGSPPDDLTTSVSPLRTTRLVGETFSINLTVNEVQELRGYAYVLRYNTTMLTALSYTNLAYLVDPDFTAQYPSTINDTQGYVVVSYQTTGTSGFSCTEPKPLVKITFRVDTSGTSALNIDEAETRLFDMHGYVWRYPYNLNINDGVVTTPEVAVAPQIIVGPPPKITETFNVNITITDVIDLYTWQAGMTFNASVLECLGITEGEFLKRAGIPTLWTPGSIDNTNGIIHYSACSRTGPNPGVNGSGQLMSITFSVKGSGNSTLHPTDVLLLDSNLVSIEPVAIVDGHVQIHVQDIAILSVTTSATEAYPTWTIPLNVTVVVENQGTRTETFDVTAYANTTAIGTKAITLDAGDNTELVFSWNLAGVTEGTYTIRANTTVLYGEIDIADNTMTDGIVKIKHPGDANGDNVLNAYDLGILAKAWLTKVGEPLYDARADFNGDGSIDTLDHGILKAYWP